MLFKFREFIKESISEKHFNYYAFDMDDNILNMPTKIRMDRRVGENRWIPVDVSTSEFAEVRTDLDNWRLRNESMSEAFSEFTDEGERGSSAFIEDMKFALKKKSFGPSWNDFIECLTNGSIFAIITARGHESHSIRRGIEYIIDNYLSDTQLQEMNNNLLKFEYLFGDLNVKHPKILRSSSPSKTDLFVKYLDLCDYVCVGNPKYAVSGTLNPEKEKEKALINFSKRVSQTANYIGYTARIGFSDDDLKNVNKIESLIQNVTKEEFPYIKEYVVKNTNNPKDVKITKRVIEYVDPSKQSVISSTTFGNMTSHLYPSSSNNRQDDFYHQHLKRTEYLRKINKDIINDNEEE